MAARQIVTIRDASGEISSFGLAGADLTAANFDAQLAAWSDFRTALNSIIIGNLARYKILARGVEVNNTNPANSYAQRELKWLVSYRGTSSGVLHQVEIACPDLTLLVSGTDIMNISSGVGADFVNAFEAVVRLGNTGTELVDVDSIRLIGRNI